MLIYIVLHFGLELVLTRILLEIMGILIQAKESTGTHSLEIRFPSILLNSKYDLMCVLSVLLELAMIVALESTFAQYQVKALLAVRSLSAHVKKQVNRGLIKFYSMDKLHFYTAAHIQLLEAGPQY